MYSFCCFIWHIFKWREIFVWWETSNLDKSVFMLMSWSILNVLSAVLLERSDSFWSRKVYKIVDAASSFDRFTWVGNWKFKFSISIWCDGVFVSFRCIIVEIEAKGRWKGTKNEKRGKWSLNKDEGFVWVTFMQSERKFLNKKQPHNNQISMTTSSKHFLVHRFAKTQFCSNYSTNIEFQIKQSKKFKMQNLWAILPI